jgi:hypothetical protein
VRPPRVEDARLARFSGAVEGRGDLAEVPERSGLGRRCPDGKGWVEDHGGGVTHLDDGVAAGAGAPAGAATL